MRGRGDGAELIRRGVHTILTRYGVRNIIADTDTRNLPTRDGVLKTGFAEKEVIELYQKVM